MPLHAITVMYGAVGLIHTRGPKLAAPAGKYGPLIPILRELALRADTPLRPAVKEMIARQLDNAAIRLTAVTREDDAV